MYDIAYLALPFLVCSIERKLAGCGLGMRLSLAPTFLTVTTPNRLPMSTLLMIKINKCINITELVYMISLIDFAAVHAKM